ncbi:uncharacterized protein ARMOST_10488 [Armillaria ostoyae]|uniref:Uncharacterized protein n=1 Tax=Armillaria ostoyae TaxID=47428 RepID=A0A284REJ6_ARMOS|nr:uncharacterized protein ARMOST_10488 [Armillaria ostoyae]
MLVGDPYCPFKADVWYLGRMLDNDLGAEVKGFVEKHIKIFQEDFTFDNVFGKYFSQESTQNNQTMQSFEEYIDKINEVTVQIPTELTLPKATLRTVFSLLTMISQMRMSDPESRPSLSQLIDSVIEMRRSCSPAVLYDYIGISSRAAEWEKQ